MKLFPAIDLSLGKCVRLEQGCFDRTTVYGDDPLAMAASFVAQGAAALHVVDLDGARDAGKRQLALIKSLTQGTSVPIQTGGGVRSADDVQSLLQAGVARVIIGSLTVREPALCLDMLRRFGADRLVFALDVRLGDDGTPWVAQSGWAENTKVSLWQALERYVPAGLHTVLCTDIGRDGMLVGPSVELYRVLRQRYPHIEMLASGGVATLDDLRTLRQLGADGTIIGKSLYAGRFTLPEALAC